MTPESLSRATARAVSHSVCGGKAELTPAELAGALSGLDFDQSNLAWWKYLGDDGHAKRMLEASAVVRAHRLAIDEGWSVTRVANTVRRLAEIAVNDEVNPRICPACHNDTKERLNCNVCNGTGRLRAAALWRIADIGIKSWEARWSRRYKLIAADMKDWVGGLDQTIIRKCRQER